MSYSSFTLSEVREKFQLELLTDTFFPELAPIAVSIFLQQALAIMLPIATVTGSEKARSEFIVAPILAELRALNHNTISIFSGEELTVDSPTGTLREREQGLNGICDFIIGHSPSQLLLEAPIVTIVEAKKGSLQDGWGQPATQGSEETSEQSVAVCIAEMVAAQRFNTDHGRTLSTIYGIVTSGTLWQFIQLDGKLAIIDPEEYKLNPVEKLLAYLQWMLKDSCRAN